ncbi:hypothetical protein SAMN05421766_101114 [Zobellia uliginosa]|uniref:Uncharacterized protein n=1 Tax=Zobellia uliginosa TaxID=143224 RepID=A0ABY1KHW4_9FLAO|nr:hypothetical protein SAMN05421766_101114 [Zobellia uliginosa]
MIPPNRTVPLMYQNRLLPERVLIQVVPPKPIIEQSLFQQVGRVFPKVVSLDGQFMFFILTRRLEPYLFGWQFHKIVASSPLIFVYSYAWSILLYLCPRAYSYLAYSNRGDGKNKHFLYTMHYTKAYLYILT